ncbi:MAG: hypothetical protein IT239_06125, partial [Bacteroidia bacterium]|nr:hypothetical protein [Bacteroidia bacterium]
MLSKYYCDGNPTLLGTFDLSYAPTLIFYAYIPIILISLFLGIFVLFKDKYSIQSKLFFSIAVLFSLWNLNIILEWVTVPVNLNLFFWEITMFLEMPIFLLSVYFIHTFFNKSDVSFKTKLIFGILWLPVILLLPTTINIKYFDVLNCQGNVGYLTYYVYTFEVLSVLWVIIFSIKKFWEGKINRKQIIILATGISFFLTVFSASNIFGELTQVYAINLFGPIGMVIFLGLLSYMIVRFKAFNIKLLATEALVWGLGILIGSQFFFIRTTTNRILNSITFISAIIFGHFLVKSVKIEVEQKEELAKLNIDLKNLIKQRESLVHLVTHKVKGSFTRTKALFAGIADGTFGDISPEIKRRANQGLEFDNNGIQTVDLV